ncbi:unnamed protein product [Caenorhabditis angaria]|uniref:Integrator complex subunit 1 RPB2-binding domain-containing protein n=1 Tax=Caenorhabditis angaria TaxID=860376 RepID=A0A9P1MVT0_9PELO|nr:unnamed protein product [Caenorhabditis angaria]
MDKKKHKRLDDGIMKPSDLKKSRIVRGTAASSSGTSVSSSSGTGIKPKLDFRGVAAANKQSTIATNTFTNIGMRPILDDKWKEFGDTINLNPENYHKSILEAIEQEKHLKVARLIVAALKHFTQNEKICLELRIIGAIADAIKKVGDKLNQTAVHKGFLYIISNSRQLPEKIQELLVSILTTLASKQQALDGCYILAFLNDAVGTNVGIGTANKSCWIDKPYSEELVHLILRPFETVYPTQELYSACQIENFSPGEYFPKFSNSFEMNENRRTQIIGFVDVIKSWFDNIRGENIPKSVFRTLGIFCGCEQVRQFISTRLEIWITSQKFHREISELLLILGCNINAEKELDREFIEVILKLNTKIMKTRTISAPFNVAIRKICENPINVRFMFESLMLSEIGQIQNRSTSNFPTMFMLLGIQPIESTNTIGRCCAYLLVKEKEACMKTLRSFLKELIRGFNHTRNGEFPFSIFAHSFLDRISLEGESETGIDTELPRLVCELLCQVPLFTITSLLVTRENAFAAKYNISSSNGEPVLIPPEARITREKFQQEYRLYCEVFLKWLAKEKMAFPDDNVHLQCYYLLFYLEKHREVYTNVEGAAVNDVDLPNCIRIFGECGISEKMIMLLFGEVCCAIPNKNSLEIATLITQRAAANYPKFSETSILEFVNIDPFKLIDRTLQISVYGLDELTRLPEMPLISSKSLYWMAWNLIVLWLIAGSKISSRFDSIYSSYPTLRYLIHAILVRKFEFPMNFEGKTSQAMMDEDDSIMAKEALMLSQYEKIMSLPQNSLVNTSCVFITKEHLRVPPSFDDIRIISDKYRLTARLCLCESPPLLKNLIEMVGAQNSLSAIKEMLSVDSSTVDKLTSECLFHALVYYFDLSKREKESNNIMNALIKRTKTNLESENEIDNDILLRTLISSLSSSNSIERSAAVSVFAQIFPSIEDNKHFHMSSISKIPRFEAKKAEFLETIATAVKMESDTNVSKMYLTFLSENFEKSSMHKIAKIICSTVLLDRFSLRNSLCDFFVNYIDSCIELCKFDGNLENVEKNGLKVIEIATTRILIDDETPNSIIRLLSKYSGEDKSDSKPFENLLELWLSPGSVPKIINLKTGQPEKFLCLPMRKEMLKSADQRVVEAALDEMSESDAQSFVLVSQMSNETADKVLSKAENMNVSELDFATLSNIYIIIRGYRLKGVKSGEKLVENVRSRLDSIRQTVKDEPMIIDSFENATIKPAPFISQTDGDVFKFSLENMTMTSDEISAWLKTNCSISAKTPVVFNLPPEFVQSAISNEQSALACLQIIETNLKFFLSNESAFHTLVVIVDTASHKFNSVRTRLETLAVRLLKSVNPPASVSGVLKKHASTSTKSALSADEISMNTFSKFSEIAEWLKANENSKQKRNVLSHFMSNFIDSDGLKEEDVMVVIKSVWEVHNVGTIEIAVEKCICAPWSPKLKRRICRFLLEKYQTSVPTLLIYRLIDSYCQTWPIASYRQLFCKESENSINDISLQSLAMYLSELSSTNDSFDWSMISLLTKIEKEGGIQAGFCIGQQLLQISCAHQNVKIREGAERLLKLLSDQLIYLTYKSGVVGSMRLTSNIISRDKCIKNCERIVDQLIEVQTDANFLTIDTVCDDPNPNPLNPIEKNDEPATIGMKRHINDRRGGPPNKKGKWRGESEEGEITQENETKSNSTVIAMQQFNSMLKFYPNIVKTKFPILANFISQLTAKNKKELKEENRIKKVELVLNCIIELSLHMKNDEFSSIETALTNCFEFYEKHVEEGLLHVKEQVVFSELLLKACCAYLNRSSNDARILLRDHRILLDRICKRCRYPFDVELIIDNITVGYKSLKFGKMSDDYMEDDEDYGFEYEDDSGSEPDVDMENQYYTAKGLRSDGKLDEAIKAFEKVLELEEEKGEWGFKALKQMIKITFGQNNLEKMLGYYGELLTYIKSAVTKNYSEKSINAILDYISTSRQMNLLKQFYETTLEALKDAKNERLWFKTNTKLGKLFFDLREFEKLEKIVKQLKGSCKDEQGEEDQRKGTQLLEIYALEIQMYTEQKNNKALKSVYELAKQAIQTKSAIPHPLILGVIRDSVQTDFKKILWRLSCRSPSQFYASKVYSQNFVR